ncbi:MAG: PspA-associated protein PspAA [Sporichthyaceae bacterium]
MIIRILGEGQLSVPEDVLDELNKLDADVEAAIAEGDENAFGSAMAALLECARSAGTPLDDEDLMPSDAVLPPADCTLAEARDMMREDGLIPG